MKKFSGLLWFCSAIFTLLIVVSSCSKMEEMQGRQMAVLLHKNKPNVPQCPPGYHWDYTYKECVPDSPACAPGYHWDPNAGGCVPDNPPPPQPDTIAVMTNANNPYDYAGEDHNEAVETIFPNIDPSAPNVDSVIEAQVKNYAVSNWDVDADSIQMAYDTMQVQWNVPPAQFPRLDSLGNDLYTQGEISSEANSYIQQMYSIAHQWLNVDTLTQDEYNNFASGLISLENQIGDDNSLASSEKNGLLIACSISRYSADYWGNYINNQQLLPSIKQHSVHPDLWRLLAKVLTYTLVDAEGAVEASAYSPPVTPGTAAICVGVGAATSILYACGE